MPIAARNKNQFTLIYNSNKVLGKKVKAFAMSSKKKLHAIDLKNETLGQSIWAEISVSFKDRMQELIDFKTIDAQKDASFSEHDLIKIIEKNPDALKFPILIYDQTIVQIKQEADLLEYFDVDSGGFKKTMHTEPVKTNKTSQDGSFTGPIN